MRKTPSEDTQFPSPTRKKGKRTGSLRLRSSLRNYLREITATPLLEAEEEKVLAEEIRLADSALLELAEWVEQNPKEFGVLREDAPPESMSTPAFVEALRTWKKARCYVISTRRITKSDAMEESAKALLRTVEEGLLLLKNSPFPPPVTQLLQRIQTGTLARERFIQANLKLVVNISIEFRRPSVPQEVCISEGNMGLLLAVEHFDAEYGRFSTYAAPCIRRRMQSARRDLQVISVPEYINAYKYRDAIANVCTMLGHYPSFEEFQAHSTLRSNLVSPLYEGLSFLPKLPETGEGDTGEDTDLKTLIVENRDTPEEHMEKEETIAELQKALNLLQQTKPIYLDILRLRFGLDGIEPLVLEKIGAHLGMTKQNVFGLQSAALKKLRTLLEEDESI